VLTELDYTVKIHENLANIAIDMDSYSNKSLDGEPFTA
jgi:hypothetical protein